MSCNVTSCFIWLPWDKLECCVTHLDLFSLLVELRLWLCCHIFIQSSYERKVSYSYTQVVNKYNVLKFEDMKILQILNVLKWAYLIIVSSF